MDSAIKIQTRDLSFSYNGKGIIRHSSMDFAANRITAIVGPSGSGKSTFLMILNRLWEVIPHCRLEGRVAMELDGSVVDIYSDNLPVTRLRRKVGMVFQNPNPLPMSIAANITFPLQLQGRPSRDECEGTIRKYLKIVGLWQEVKDRLDSSALDLSGGQQQRLCIARALVLQPEILLLDEPTSSLDQEAADIIEDLLKGLTEQCTILLVSHYRDQVQRIGDHVVELRNKTLAPSPSGPRP